MDLAANYWLVVYSIKDGDFKNAVILAKENEDIKRLTRLFEKNNPGYLVIRIGNGNLPPKAYRSLPYINK